MLLLLSSAGTGGLPRRARMSVMIWFSCVRLGAAGDVQTLGTTGGPVEKPRPVTLSFWSEVRLLIASVVFVALRVEMPGTGGGGGLPPLSWWAFPLPPPPVPLLIEVVGGA